MNKISVLNILDDVIIAVVCLLVWRLLWIS